MLLSTHLGHIKKWHKSELDLLWLLQLYCREGDEPPLLCGSSIAGPKLLLSVYQSPGNCWPSVSQQKLIHKQSYVVSSNHGYFQCITHATMPNSNSESFEMPLHYPVLLMYLLAQKLMGSGHKLTFFPLKNKVHFISYRIYSN